MDSSSREREGGGGDRARQLLRCKREDSTLIASLDVHYRPDGSACGACALARGPLDPGPFALSTVQVSETAPYEPGRFYLRELPILLALLECLPTAPELVLVDGFVWLGPDRPGLGAHLHEALDARIPVVGIAKTPFRGAEPLRAVTRGESHRPLYVSVVGWDLERAAELVRTLPGPHRLPDLLRAADGSSRRAGVE